MVDEQKRRQSVIDAILSEYPFEEDIASKVARSAHYHVEDAFRLIDVLGGKDIDTERLERALKLVEGERVLCSAVYVNDGRDHHRRTYRYPKTGLVFYGLRHPDCYVALYAWWNLLPAAERRRIGDPDKLDGFLTNLRGFVDRAVAWEVAKAADQILPQARRPGHLFSEDIY